MRVYFGVYFGVALEFETVLIPFKLSHLVSTWREGPLHQLKGILSALEERVRANGLVCICRSQRHSQSHGTCH